MAIDQDVTEEAVEALQWVLNRRLTPDEWSYAEQAMRMLDDALAAGDPDALREAVFDLDQLSRRVQEKLGKDSAVPAEPKHRDRANELIHRLTPDRGTNKQPPTDKPK